MRYVGAAGLGVGGWVGVHGKARQRRRLCFSLFVPSTAQGGGGKLWKIASVDLSRLISPALGGRSRLCESGEVCRKLTPANINNVGRAEAGAAVESLTE